METTTAFLEVFGDSPIQRALDFLIINEEFDYSMTDIAELSGVGYSTLKLFWPKLEAEKMVKNTRTVGNAKMYRLNDANPVVRKLKELYWVVTKRAVREKIREELVSAQ